jgi:hypothetical protein
MKGVNMHIKLTFLKKKSPGIPYIVHAFIPGIAILMLNGAISNSFASSCCTVKSGAGPRVGAFSGNIMEVGNFIYNPHIDTSGSFASLYGYFGNSWSTDGHTGDPLGTGGKWPLIYTTELYREQNITTKSLLKNDLRVQYVDFGYIPLWRSNTLGAFGKWHMSPELTGQFQMVYGGDPGKPGTNSNGSIGIGEISLQWAPTNLPGFWIKAGNILDGGTYSSIFDQDPIENYIFTGLSASIGCEVGSFKTVSSLSFGGNFLNTVFLSDKSDLLTDFPGFVRAGRQRTFAYAKSSWLLNNKFGVKLVGGIQYVPEDSSQKMLKKEGSDPFYHYSKGFGSMGGIEATWFGKKLSHAIVVSGAFGDAMIGSSSPDAVLKPAASNPVIIDKLDFDYDPHAWEFSRNKSGLLNIIYWNGLEFGKFHFTGGAWYTVRIPEKTALSFINPMADSIRNAHPDVSMHDSVITLSPENFKALKFSLFPTYQVGFSPLYIGFRFDNISYLTPDAHTNAIEPERDQTLRASSPAATSLYGPSKWEREAVNVNILSPSIRLDFNKLGGITLAYSYALYNKPVDRQGKVSKQHSNLTVSADISLTHNSKKDLLLQR